MKTFLDIVKECDNFPYAEGGNDEEYRKAIEPLWRFFLPDDPEPHGFLIQSVVDRMPWTSSFNVDPLHKAIHLQKPAGRNDWQAACNEAIDDLLGLARSQNAFPLLGKKREEKFPIVGARFDIAIERSAISLFGIIGQGAHMTVYTRTSEGSYLFWIPRRSATKSTYPGMLDQAVAGGVAWGETPFKCIVREAGEEAALSEDLVRQKAVACGTVTWFNISDSRAGGEPGLMNPGVLFLYDLAVGPETVFRPVEDDIQSFQLMDTKEVANALRQGEFKPSCAAVMIDFFIRHGIITAESEASYVEMVSRLHRKLPFRTT
ncbi:putative thiamine pyrophosphokinase [Podospora aff. communis PSN243]|uniref:Thiamine pyrophosphokinase n=1 Tax=Podospora aff. communis PSN243 TaxID=3040156 RepID=A0AAV9G1C8_9PEZI|nr:putative thiamine pyrophosphokinase [Podospora aff. communis PSN243]